jgi:hypothetical protein
MVMEGKRRRDDRKYLVHAGQIFFPLEHLRGGGGHPVVI